MTSMFFNPFGMVLGIACVYMVTTTILEMYKTRLKHRSGDQALKEAVDTLTGQLARIEQRMANLESIVIEREKDYAFRDALDGER